MLVTQPTLWDNLALEKGYSVLSDLDFEEATVQFEEALNGPGDRQSLLKAIASVQYWEPRITSLSSPDISPDTIKKFTDDFISYNFTAQLIGFKRAILICLVDVMIHDNLLVLEETKIVFDELLKMDEFRKAVYFMGAVIKVYPGKHYLLYFLAQAQWLNGDSAPAYGNYIRALLHHPDEALVNRIENEKLKTLAQSYGMASAPAYGWLRAAMPFVTPVNDITPLSEAHQSAVTAYCLLQQSEESIKKNDLKSSIRYRKELRKISPRLYEEYFALLQKRKG